MTNYKTMTKRINNAITISDLKRLDKSLDRLFEAGVFSIIEFNRLYDKILKRGFKLKESLI